MLHLQEQITIPFPPEIVWPLLLDVEALANCIPGVKLSAAGTAGAFGTLRVQLGTEIAVFRGQVALSFDPKARRCSYTLHGAEPHGRRSKLTGTGAVSLTGDGETLLAIDGALAVSGPLEAIALAAGLEALRRLVTGFGEKLGQLAAMQGMPVPEAEHIPLIEPEGFLPEAPPLPTPPAAPVVNLPVPLSLVVRDEPIPFYVAMLAWARQLLPRIRHG